ncbi:MAG TPA: PAS domain-containing protein, partial [Phycisphaerae bacterium]|nr:PAS domain-containing protein [Phycisphaerae bacterium]
MAEVARCHATGGPFACEYRAVARDGRVVWFRDEARMIRDEAGRPLCLQGVMLDITEQKRADHLLRLQRDLAVALSRPTALPEAMHQVLDAALSVDGIECGGIYLADP